MFTLSIFRSYMTLIRHHKSFVSEGFKVLSRLRAFPASKQSDLHIKTLGKLAFLLTRGFQREQSPAQNFKTNSMVIINMVAGRNGCMHRII